MSNRIRHLTTQELADRLGISLNTIKYWRATGQGPVYMRVGKHVRYRVADVEAWEESCLRRPRPQE
jgi:excisionase family DNA binding protein